MKRRSIAGRLARLALAVIVVAAIALLVVQGWYFAHVLWWVRHDPVDTSFMRARLEKAATPSAKLQQRTVPYAQISSHLKRAVISAEDAKFLHHAGFDWEAMHKALEKNLARGRTVSGASTISQQLAKNLFLSGERRFTRKFQEAAIAWMLEVAMDKRRILELYLNFAEWGEGVFGAEAAARHHFGIPARALDARQAAWLAVILPSPRRYRAGNTTPYLESRVETILRRMPAAQVP